MKFTVGASPTPTHSSAVLPSSRADVIILACSKDEETRALTSQALRSLRSSEAPGTFHVILVESHPEAPEYPEADLTLRPELPFNYNRFLNEAMKATREPYVVISNNDVIFHASWWTNMRGAMRQHNLDTASPRSPRQQQGLVPEVEQAHRNTPSNQVVLGHVIAYTFCGWCWAMKREVADWLFPLDDQFTFFYQDNDICMRLMEKNCRHGLVGGSMVSHYGQRSHRILVEQNRYEEYTRGMGDKFAAKWSKNQEPGPKLTVIIGTYKRHDHLMGMLYSMKNQTRKDWVLHIVSDGDDPELEALLAPHLSDQIQLSFIEGPNRDWGYKARNSILEKCETEYVLFTSDDNYYMPIFVEKMLQAAEQNNLDFVMCKMVHSNEKYIYDRFRNNSPQPFGIDMGQFIVRTKLAQKAGGFQGLNVMADGEFAQRIVMQNPRLRIAQLEECLYVHN